MIEPSLSARRIYCPAGTWTRLLERTTRGGPLSWQISFRGAAGAEVKGRFREVRGLLPFRVTHRPPSEGELEPIMQFSRKWTDVCYLLEVCPDGDLEAEVR